MRLSRLITFAFDTKRNETADFTEAQVRFVSLEREYFLRYLCFVFQPGRDRLTSIACVSLPRSAGYTLTRENAFVSSSEGIFVFVCVTRDEFSYFINTVTRPDCRRYNVLDGANSNICMEIARYLT